MNKKYQIFISSTYKDLIPEREKVRDVILSMYQFPIGMEMFSAADEEQWEIIKETIDSSDYYVLIIGKRYGSVIEEGSEKGISYTEKEFRYAKSIGLPILVYIKDEKIITSDNIEEDAKKLKKLNAFIEEAKKGREVKWFSSTDQLGTEVSISLHKEMDRKKRPGWIRSDAVDIEKSLSEIVELSKRNRELEEENRKLRESVIQRKPELNISIKNYGTREKPIEKGQEFERLILQDIERSGYMRVPEKRSVEDVRGVPGLSSADIANYNSNLPTKEEIKKYNDAVYVFRMMVENGYHIKCELINDGTVKAKDPSAVLRLPKEFHVIDWNEVKDKNPPMKPRIPTDPVVTQQIKNQLGPLEVIGDFAHFAYESTREYYGDGKYEVKQSSIFPDLPDVHPLWGSSVEGGKAEIWAKDLMHKSRVVTGDFCIVPLRKGTFTISVSLMCEEYIEPDEREITITVV